MNPANFLRIVLTATALAFSSTWMSPTDRVRRPLEVIPIGEGLPLLDLDQAEELWHRPGVLFLDVRSVSDYQVGHIQGALHVTREQLHARPADLMDRLARAQTLVVYCTSEDCGKSLWAALELRDAGLKQVVIFPQGWYGWLRAGFPAFKAER